MFPSLPKLLFRERAPSLSAAFHSSAHTLEDGEGTYCCFYLISSFVGYFFFVYFNLFCGFAQGATFAWPLTKFSGTLPVPNGSTLLTPPFTVHIHESWILAKAYRKKIEVLIGNDLGNNLGT